MTLAPTEDESGNLKSHFFVVLVFVYSKGVLVRIKMPLEVARTTRMVSRGWGLGHIHIHIHMLVSARVWRDKQIAMPGALRSRSFWLQDCSWAQLLRASRTHYNQKVSWLTPPPGSETSRTAAFHHSRSAPLCCGLLALSLSLPSAFTLALLLAWRLF